MSILQNFLAQISPQAEARQLMKRTMSSRARALISAVAGLAFTWTLVLSVAPGLHERIHSDANRIEHTCAVTFVASGTCDHVTQPPLIAGPSVAAQFAELPTRIPHWIESPFLLASVFEHAPPGNLLIG
jgi:hypothetical protein